MGKWDFDTLELVEYSKNPLFDIGYFLFTRAQIMEYFHIEEKKLKNFLNKIESSYLSNNFYHNSAHAADVTCSMFYLTRNGVEIQNNSLTDLDIFALIISAMCHDV